MTPWKRRLLDWLAVALCGLVILLAAPLARIVQEFISRQVGRTSIGFFVLAVLAFVLVAVAVRLFHRPGRRPLARLIGMAAVAGVFIFFTLKLWPNPEEAVHFLEYGILGFLLFRALRHSFPNVLVYPSAFLAGALVGLADETLQWVLPGRVWDFRDLGFNALAAGLVQIGLAMSIKPAGLDRPADVRSLRRVSGLAAVLLLALGLCLSNTPEAVQAATNLIPALSFLREEEPMRQVSLLHQDPQAGRFSSQLTLDWLYKTDLVRSTEYGDILRQWKTKDYSAFLRAFPSWREPFLHEFRVRVFRRDRKDAAAGRASSVRERGEALLAAVRENMLLEKYFGRTLDASGYAWPPAKRKELESQTDPARPYTSPVGTGFLSGVSAVEAWAALAVLVLILLSLNIVWPIIIRTRGLSALPPRPFGRGDKRN